MNPTNDVLEQRVAALEERELPGLAVASGMAAITYAIQTLARGRRQYYQCLQTLWRFYEFCFAHNFPRVRDRRSVLLIMMISHGWNR